MDSESRADNVHRIRQIIDVLVQACIDRLQGRCFGIEDELDQTFGGGGPLLVNGHGRLLQ